MTFRKGKPTGSENGCVVAWGEGCGEGLATTRKCRMSGGNVPCRDCGGGQILHPLRRVDVTIYK